MGALTAKPYAFSYRSWELKSIQTFDLTTPYCSSITIQKQGEKVIRILPNETTDFILPDNSRFFHDGEYQQRLKKTFKNSYYKNYKDGLNFFFPIPLKKINKIFKKELNSLNKRLYIFIGKYIDINEIKQVKSLANNVIYETFIYSAEEYTLRKNLKSAFYVTSNLKSINETNNILFLGYHPSQEDALLSAAIRKNTLNRNLSVFSFGHPKTTIYKVINIGNSFFELKKFILGKYLQCKIFETKIKNLLIFNSKLNSFSIFEKIFQNLFVNFSLIISNNKVLFNLECKIKVKKNLQKYLL